MVYHNISHDVDHLFITNILCFVSWYIWLSSTIDHLKFTIEFYQNIMCLIFVSCFQIYHNVFQLFSAIFFKLFHKLWIILSCEIVSKYFTIFYEMLHANVLHKSIFSRWSHCFAGVSALVKTAIALSGSISAYVSFGQFLWPVPRLALERTAASRHGCHVISMSKFDHCITVQHQYTCTLLHFPRKAEVQCFAGSFFAWFALDRRKCFMSDYKLRRW